MFSEIAPLQIGSELSGEKRKVCSLNGSWEAQEADFSVSVDALPTVFANRIPVPGLWDMAATPVSANAVWYQKDFLLEGDVPQNVVLKINKAFWGKYIYINGRHIADHQPNFTPAHVSIAEYLHGNGAKNHIRIKVGAKGTQPPESGEPVGFDFEKHQYIPGIYDDVSLILTGNPMIQHIQTAPHLADGTVTVQVTLSNTGEKTVSTPLSIRIYEKNSGKMVCALPDFEVAVPAGQQVQVQKTAFVADAQHWSPETPFLYLAEAETAADKLSCVFGMREFRFDCKSGCAMLNGAPYFLRGTNITMYRFFEDPLRGDLPWNREWAKKVLQSFQRLNMNSIRYCIGFPPELWYELADEMGFLIDDEYPIWSENELPEQAAQAVIPELCDWIHERANHPCVVIWDIQNETLSKKTSEMIQTMRSLKLDLSDRPWDNGWTAPAAENDSIECHPYLFADPHFQLSCLNRCVADPAPYNHYAFFAENAEYAIPELKNPRMINEYSWLWLNRDGSPTTLTEKLYNNLLPGGTAHDRRDYFSLALAQVTEYWRAGRKAAGVLDFCGLTYGKEGGQTCDYYLPDIRNPQFDPLFEKRMADAMAPVGIVIEEWSETQYAGREKTFPVSILNDLSVGWAGDVLLTLQSDGRLYAQEQKHYTAAPYEKVTQLFSVMIPDEPGVRFCLTASYRKPDGRTVASERYICNGLPVPSPSAVVLSVGKPVIATSSAEKHPAEKLTRNTFTDITQMDENWWHSQTDGLSEAEINAQQVTVDLEKVQAIGQMLVTWGDPAPKRYTVDVSADGQRWDTVLSRENSISGLAVLEIGRTARYVRLNMTESCNNGGYSIGRIELL